MRRIWALALAVPILAIIGASAIVLLPAPQSKILVPEKQLSPYVIEYALPTPDSGPMSIATDKVGNVWIGLGGLPGKRGVAILAKFDPLARSFTQYQIPEVQGNAQLWGLISSDDGNLWFAEASTNSIWQFNTANLKFRRFLIPTPNAFPVQIAFDRNGKVWFTETFSNKIGVLDPETGGIEEYAAPGKEPTPVGLTFEAQGRLWVTLAGGPQTPPLLAVFDPITKQFTTYEPPAQISLPTGIAIDNSEAIWFTQHRATSKVSRFFFAENRLVDYVASTTEIAGSEEIALPYWISTDNSGAIWFNEHFANRIAKLIPEKGILIEYIIPADKIVNAISFALDPRGNVWFVEWTENKFGMIDTSIRLPYELTSTASKLTLKPGQETSVSLSATANSSSQVEFSVSASTHPLGKLVNLTTFVNPPTLILDDSSTADVNLTLRIHEDLLPGTYTLNITVKGNFVSFSLVLELRVTPLGS